MFPLPEKGQTKGSLNGKKWLHRYVHFLCSPQIFKVRMWTEVFDKLEQTELTVILAVFLFYVKSYIKL